MLKRVGESRHPSQTPTVVWNQSPMLLLATGYLYIKLRIKVTKDLLAKHPLTSQWSYVISGLHGYLSPAGVHTKTKLATSYNSNNIYVIATYEWHWYSLLNCFPQLWDYTNPKKCFGSTDSGAPVRRARYTVWCEVCDSVCLYPLHAAINAVYLGFAHFPFAEWWPLLMLKTWSADFVLALKVLCGWPFKGAISMRLVHIAECKDPL